MLRLLPTVFVLALIFSGLLTRIVRALSHRFNLVSAPTLERHLHRLPVPRLGGIAIFGAFALALWSSNALLKHLGLHDFAIGITHTSLAAIVVAGAMVFAIGVYDDLRNCTAWPKLLVEAAAATLIFASGVRIGAFPLLGQNFGTLVSYVLTVFFVILVTNAFNLIDGMDGLAAGSATFSTIAVAIIAGMNHRNPALLIAVGLAGVLLGFLRFNFAPATIFMGDSGSLFVGFVLSAAAISGTQKLPTFVAVVAPVIVFATPVLDTSLSVLRRHLRGRSIFSADRDHIHHRLLHHGFSQRQAVLALYSTSGASALFALLLLYPDARATALVLLAFICVLALLIRKLDYEELRHIRVLFRSARLQRFKFEQAGSHDRLPAASAGTAQPELAVSLLDGVLAPHQAHLVSTGGEGESTATPHSPAQKLVP